MVMNGIRSSWKPVRLGHSRNSILGPTLFNIIINEQDER